MWGPCVESWFSQVIPPTLWSWYDKPDLALSPAHPHVWLSLSVPVRDSRGTMNNERQGKHNAIPMFHLDPMNLTEKKWHMIPGRENDMWSSKNALLEEKSLTHVHGT